MGGGGEGKSGMGGGEKVEMGIAMLNEKDCIKIFIKMEKIIAYYTEKTSFKNGFSLIIYLCYLVFIDSNPI